METVQLKNDIRVLYVKATSFPDDVSEAWEKLHSILPKTEGRNFYGISHGDKDGGIVYMAAVEESYQGEAEKLACNSFLIPQGSYISETLRDWKKDMSSIGKTFQKLLADPRMDHNGFCLEQYINESDVKCMVKIV